MPKQKVKRPDAKWEVFGVSRRRLQPAPQCPAAYTLRVYLVGGPPHAEWDELIWRDIVLRADQTLHDLHFAIFDAFDREDQHHYEFNLGIGPRDRSRTFTIEPGPSGAWFEDFESADAMETTLDSLGLQEGRRFGYWFDFGDDWKHVVEVIEVHEEKPKGKLPRVLDRQGKSPPQYEPWEE